MKIDTSSLPLMRFVGLLSGLFLACGAVHGQWLTFDDYTAGPLAGQRGWTSTGFGNLPVHVGAVPGSNGLAIGTGFTPSRQDNASANQRLGNGIPTASALFDQGSVTIEYDFRFGNSTLSAFGFVIPNTAAVSLTDSTGKPFFSVSYTSPHFGESSNSWRFIFGNQFAGGMASDNIVLDRFTWYSVRVTYRYFFDRPASGTRYGGSLTAYYKKRGTEQWIPINGANRNWTQRSDEGNARLLGSGVSSVGLTFGVNSVADNIRVVASNDGPGSLIREIDVPHLLPGAILAEARALAEQPGRGVLVAVSGTFPQSTIPSGNDQRTSLALSENDLPALLDGQEISTTIWNLGNASSRFSSLTANPGRAAFISSAEPAYSNPQPYTLSQVVRLLSNGQPDPTFTRSPGADGTINAMSVQSDGKILVGGTFTVYNGIAFRNVARLNADGAPDSTFITGSGPDAQVNSIAIQTDGRILIGGTFRTVGTDTRPFLARLDPNGSVDPTFTVSVDGAVNSISLQPDGRILIGGAFVNVANRPRARIARLLLTGDVDASFDPGAGATDEVVTILPQNDGNIIVGGDFVGFGSQNRARIVRLLATGSIDPRFSAAAAANNTVLSLGLERDGKILLGGAFTEVNGQPRSRLARLRTDGSLDPDFDPGSGANRDVRAILPRSDGTIFLAGLFDQYQGNPANAVVVVLGSAQPTTVSYLSPSPTATAGDTARLVAEGSGVGSLTYRWLKNDVAIADATTSSIVIPNVSAAHAGKYTVEVTSSIGSVARNDTTLTVGIAGRGLMINVAGRADGGSGDTTFVTGFSIGGSGSKQMLIRAAGPALTPLGVTGAMANPRLRLFKGAEQIGVNDDWPPDLGPTVARLAAFPFPVGSRDAGLLVRLEAGSYTAVVDDESGGSGVVLAEAYDADSDALTATARLDNLSIRARVGAGDKVLISGVVVAGTTPRVLLFRGIGPRLVDFGLDPSSVLRDPVITLTRSGGSVIGTNDNWNSATNAPEIKLVTEQVGAFTLLPGSKDAALLVRLPPGQYTVTCSGTNGDEGVALVEIYYVP